MARQNSGKHKERCWGVTEKSDDASPFSTFDISAELVLVLRKSYSWTESNFADWWIELLEGKTVNLRVRDKEDVDFLAECFNDIDFWGEYNHPAYEQISRSSLMNTFDNPSDFLKVIEFKLFVIEKKDGARIGVMWHLIDQPVGAMDIGCFLVPSERDKGYGTEAAQLMVDYLFLYRDVVRIQTTTNVRNKPGQRALEKAGFRIEGTMRKLFFVRGVWNDFYLLSILREEWKEPKILTKTAWEKSVLGLAEKVIAELSREKRGRDKMKYLVLLGFVERDMMKIGKKLQQYEEAKKKEPDKYPDVPFPAHIMYKEVKGFSVWEGTDAQVARKVAFLLPEIQCTLIPIVDGREFLKLYMEIKR
jgi:RimJ/RimL family protein N-acetyltransferase